MARKSRKGTNQTNVKSLAQHTSTPVRVFKTAIYARLSVEDSGKQSKDTIEGQIEIVSRYIQKRSYLQLCAVYQDNGRTGTNFHRKGFVQMMDAIEQGVIDCVVVKDLSRFGRSYIETSDYIEKIFPFSGIRFISVNDNYDNHASEFANSHDVLLISLRSLMDDVYAKDISYKTSSSIEIRQHKGDFIGLHAAYGYMKSHLDKTKLIIDEEVADIVRDIFDWKLAGASNVGIARRLNDLGISAPNRYRYEKGILKSECHSKGLWQQQTVKAILKNPVYTGCLSQGKTKQRLYQGLKSRKKVSPNEWVSIHDNHEAIIDKSVFDAVGDILDGINVAYHARNATLKVNSNCNDLGATENIFRGIVRCRDCGNNLVRNKEIGRVRADGSKRVRNIFICQRYEQLKEQGCGGARKYISEETLHEAVWSAIKAQTDLCANIASLISEFQANISVKTKVETITKQVTETQNKIMRLDSLLLYLYDDFCSGVLAQDEYLFAKAKFMHEKDGLKHKANEEDNNRVSAVSKFVDQKELTKDMLSILVDQVNISERNSIHITFCFRDEFQALLGYVDSENGSKKESSESEVTASA